MVTEFSHGLMVENMKVNTKEIKSMEKVYSHGQMAENTLVSGVMESNTDRAPISKKERRYEEDPGIVSRRV